MSTQADSSFTFQHDSTLLLDSEGAYCSSVTEPETTWLTQIQDLEPHTLARLLLLRVISWEDRAKLVAWFTLQLDISGRIFMTLDDHALTVISDHDRETYIQLKSLQEQPHAFISCDDPLLGTQSLPVKLCPEELLEVYGELMEHGSRNRLEHESTIQSCRTIIQQKDPRHFPIDLGGRTSLQRTKNGQEVDLGSLIAIRDQTSSPNVSEIPNSNNLLNWIHDDSYSDCDTSTLVQELGPTVCGDTTLCSSYAISLPRAPQCEISDTNPLTIISHSLPDCPHGHPTTNVDRLILPLKRALSLSSNGHRNKLASTVPCYDVPSTHGQPATYHADSDTTLCTPQDSTSILRYGDAASKFDSTGETVDIKFGDQLLIEINRQSGDEAFGTEDPKLLPIAVDLNHALDSFGRVENIHNDVENPVANGTTARSIWYGGGDIFQSSEIACCSSPKAYWADLSGASGHINETLVAGYASHHPCNVSFQLEKAGVSTTTSFSVAHVDDKQPDFFTPETSPLNACQLLISRRANSAGIDERFSNNALPSSGSEDRLAIGSAALCSATNGPLFLSASSPKLRGPQSSCQTLYTGNVCPSGEIHRNTSTPDAIDLPPLEILGTKNEMAHSFWTKQVATPENHPHFCYLNPGLILDLSKHIPLDNRADRISPIILPHPMCDFPIFEPSRDQAGFRASCDYCGIVPVRRLDFIPANGEFQAYAGVKTVSDQGDTHELQEYIGGNGSDRSDPPVYKKLSEHMVLPPIPVSATSWSLQEEIFSCLSFDSIPAGYTPYDVAEDSLMKKSFVASYDDPELSLEEGRTLGITHGQLGILSHGPHRVLKEHVAIGPRTHVSQTRPKLQKSKVLQLTKLYTDAAIQTDDPTIRHRKSPYQDATPRTLSKLSEPYSPLTASTRYIFNSLRYIFNPTLAKELGSTIPSSPAMRRRPRVQIDKGCIYPAFRGPMSALAKET